MGDWIYSYCPFFKTGLFLPRQVLITLLTCIWGFRLACSIAKRNWNKGEDPRYAAWRNEWKRFFYIRSFFQIFMLQGMVMLIVALPIIIVNTNSNGSLTLLDSIGFFIWIAGFLCEVIGDHQLGQFLLDPEHKGKVMQSGLWRYTRHPNYFGEATLWWGMFVIALSVPYGWVSILSPLLITYLLIYVSGIPLAEKFFIGNIEYDEYKKRTSAFIPWFFDLAIR